MSVEFIIVVGIPGLRKFYDITRICSGYALVTWRVRNARAGRNGNLGRISTAKEMPRAIGSRAKFP